jgi:Tfp pilus assembly protein PilN
MVKINLLRNRIGGSGPGQDTAMIDQSVDTGPSMKDAVIKLVVLMGFTVGLMMYESSNVRRLAAEQAKVQAELNRLQAEAAAKAAEVEAVKDIEVQAKELQDKLKVLKLLSKLRLREVKTLDFMQTSVPEKVWLTGINYEADKDKLDEGKFNFNGNAMATEDLTEFVKRLENSAYLRQVIVVKNQEVSNGKMSGIREFNFNADVENKQ